MRGVPGLVMAVLVAVTVVVVLSGSWSAVTPVAVWADPKPPPAPEPRPRPRPPADPDPVRTTAPPARILPAAGLGPAGSLTVTGSDAVALTFDDGPEPVNTPRMLDLLREQGVKATFCLVGQRAREFPDLVRRIVNEGHTLCNHSWEHSMTLGRGGRDAIRADLQRADDAIHAAAPGARIGYFRAPGGYFTGPLIDTAREMGMVSLYWDVDPRDWDSQSHGVGPPMVRHVVSAVGGSTRPGSIVLSHDYLKPDTVAAYRELLPVLKTRFTLIALP